MDLNPIGAADGGIAALKRPALRGVGCGIA